MNLHKDPAVPFYSSDWLLGTADLTYEEKGIYITLLCLQHAKGHLSEKIIKINIGMEIPPDVLRRFIKDENGLWYNERWEYEIIKRSKFKDHQKGNIAKRWDKTIPNEYQIPYQNDTKEIPLENVYVNENVNKNKKSKVFTPPTEEDVLAYFRTNGYKDEVAKRAFKYYTEMEWHDSKGTPIKSWKGKMVSVWFKEENRIFTPGKVNLTQMSNERKNHTS